MPTMDDTFPQALSPVAERFDPTSARLEPTADERRQSLIPLDTNGTDTPTHHEALTPITRIDSLRPDLQLMVQYGWGIELFKDDFYPDFDWIRIPKRREFDLLTVARCHPKERDSLDIPLKVRKIVGTDEKDAIMYAKMDTGADVNAINRSTVEKLFGPQFRSHLRTITKDDLKDFTLVGNNHFEAEFYVVLSFEAGRSGKHFADVKFVVIPDDWQDPDHDGMPNVMLGYQFLKQHHMVTIDPEFQVPDIDPSLEVIAETAENENAKVSRLLWTHYEQRPGVPRPKPVKGGR